MASYRVFSAAEWDFCANHPHVIFEGTEPVYYRETTSDSGVPTIDRFDIYIAMDQK